jgi:hypothetical protein
VPRQNSSSVGKNKSSDSNVSDDMRGGQYVSTAITIEQRSAGFMDNKG